MKTISSSSAALFLALAFFSCSPNNRYIESASTKRPPHGFAPILRNDDEKAGLDITTGFGYTSSGHLKGRSGESRRYESERDEFGMERKVLVERRFGREGNFENHFPSFASHAAAAFFTASPLGLHAEGAFSREDGRTHWSWDLGLSITSAFRYVGFALVLKAGTGSVDGIVRYAETPEPIDADTIPEGIALETLAFRHAGQTRISAGGNLFLTESTSIRLAPFLGFAIQGYPLKVGDRNFDELLFTGYSAYAGARYSLTRKTGLLGMAGVSGFDRFPEAIFTTRVGLDYRAGW